MLPETRSLEEFVAKQGVAASHPDLEEVPVLVAPASDGEFNTIRAGIQPRACFGIEDNHFQFDSSFVFPLDQTFNAGPLKALLDKHPGSKLAIFGHADPTGNDDFNKVLSGRRAQAIFGMLVRDVELWKDLYFHHDNAGKDRWGVRPVQIMLNMVGPTQVGSATGVIDQPTKDALADFEQANGLPTKGFNKNEEIDAPTFGLLASQYMDAICLDDDGKPFRLSTDDFIGRGLGKDGKGDFQGCGEFNPLMMFSRDERDFFDLPENKERRDTENQINRRVMVLLYRPGTKIDPARWPCPTAKEGTAACRLRFFSDADERRKNLDERREHKDEGTIEMVGTFACRFYDRQTSGSPCEGLLGNLFTVSLLLLSNSGALPLVNEPFTLTLNDGRIVKDTTDDAGTLNVANAPAGDHLLDVASVQVTVPAMLRGEAPRPTRVPGAKPFDAPQDGPIFFRFAIQLTDNLPWSRNARLRVVGEDGSNEQTFLLSGGSRVGDCRVFVFRKFPGGVRFKGEVRDGDIVLDLFGPTDLSKFQSDTGASDAVAEAGTASKQPVTAPSTVGDAAGPGKILPLPPPNRFANMPDPTNDIPKPPDVDPQVVSAILGGPIVL